MVPWTIPRPLPMRPILYPGDQRIPDIRFNGSIPTTLPAPKSNEYTAPPSINRVTRQRNKNRRQHTTRMCVYQKSPIEHHQYTKPFGCKRRGTKGETCRKRAKTKGDRQLTYHHNSKDHKCTPYYALTEPHSETSTQGHTANPQTQHTK